MPPPGSDAAPSVTESTRPGGRELGAAAAGVLALVSFAAVGRTFYASFLLPQGSGMDHLLAEELAFYALFFAFGGAAWIALATALRPTGLVEAAITAGRALARAPRATTVIVAGSVAALCAIVGTQVLGGAVISDDEHAYRFIAETLRSGGLVAPSPGTDLEFFREQFVVLTESARYGKYPIGHPLVLALGQSLGVEHLVVPALTGSLAFVVWSLSVRISGSLAGVLALALFATSPHVLFTGSTYLSQPTAAVCTGLAVVFLLTAEDKDRRRPAWLFAAGTALGFGVLVRPLPLGLFVGIAAIFVGVDGRRLAAGWPTRLAALLAPIVVALGVGLAVNRAQVGQMLVTAYGQSLAPDGGPAAILLTTVATPAVRAMSVMGMLIRLNFWLFGWPCSLWPCVAARLTRPSALLWGMVLAQVVYRVLSPKVGIGGAGPVYVFETTPLMCVLGAAGAENLARRGHGLLGSPHRMAAVILAGMLVNVSAFVPSELGNLRRMGAAQNVVRDLVHERGIHHALVFHESVVPWWTRQSWAYYPPTNSPGLDDDVLFVHLQRKNGLGENLDFWKRRYPSRSAWYFGYVEGRPVLLPLEEFTRYP